MVDRRSSEVERGDIRCGIPLEKSGSSEMHQSSVVMKRPYQELGGDYFDRIRAEGLKRYYVKRLQGLGLQVTLAPN